MKVDNLETFRGGYCNDEESQIHVPQVLHSSSSELSNPSAEDSDTEASGSRQSYEQKIDNDGVVPDSSKVTRANTTRLTDKVFEKDNDGQAGEEIERAEPTELPITRTSNTAKNMKSSLALQLMDSFATEDINDISWLKDDVDDTQECSDPEEEDKEIEIYHDPPVFFQDDSLANEYSVADSNQLGITETSAANGDEGVKKTSLRDISSAFVNPLEVDHSDDPEDPLVSVFDTAGQYEKAITFDDIFGKRDFSISKFISKWKSPPETSCDSRNPMEDTPPAYETTSSHSNHHQSRDWRSQFVNSKFWSSIKVEEENKENHDPSSPSNFNLNSIWKNWRSSYYKVESTGDHDNSSNNIERSPPQIPLFFNSPNKDTEAHRRSVRESLRLKERRQKLAKSSTRSMENLKIRFDTLKAEFHYKNSLRRETEELNRNSTERLNPSLHEIESFFNRSNMPQYKEDVSLKNLDSCFISKAELSGSQGNSGKLKVVDNKIKLSRDPLKRELRIRHEGSLENLCRDENIPKVEVLRRMKDGTIKTRGGR